MHDGACVYVCVRMLGFEPVVSRSQKEDVSLVEVICVLYCVCVYVCVCVCVCGCQEKEEQSCNNLTAFHRHMGQWLCVFDHQICHWVMCLTSKWVNKRCDDH